MRQVSHALRSLWARGSPLSQEAGGEMFTHVRRRLTFWYTAVLAGMLLLFGIVLYFSVQGLLYQPLQNEVSHRADDFVVHWGAFQAVPCWQNDQSGFPSSNKAPPTISGGQAYFSCLLRSKRKSAAIQRSRWSNNPIRDEFAGEAGARNWSSNRNDQRRWHLWRCLYLCRGGHGPVREYDSGSCAGRRIGGHPGVSPRPAAGPAAHPGGGHVDCGGNGWVTAL